MNVSYYIAKRISQSSTTGYSGKLIKLAIATIALSIAVMILSSVVIKGFKNEISDKIFGFWGNIHITDTHVTRNQELRPIANTSAIKDSLLSIEKIEYKTIEKNATIQSTKGGVKAVSPYITFPGILKNSSSDLEGLILKGVNNEYDEQIFKPYLKMGQWLTFNDSLASRDILISEQTALRLRLSLDDKVNIHFLKDRDQIKRRFVIKGIYKTGLEEYDRKFAFIDLRIIQNILDWDARSIEGYEVFLDQVEDAEPIADYIYNEILPSTMYAETIQEKHRNIFEWLELQDINETIILILMIIVALINMVTALLILILERSKMIGVLKSLGQSNWSIRNIFIYNALYIMLLAILFGNIIGMGMALLQKKFGFIKLDEENYYLSQVPIKFDFTSLLYINAGTILITLLVMIIPTFIVTRISPIDILRFE